MKVNALKSPEPHTGFWPAQAALYKPESAGSIKKGRMRGGWGSRMDPRNADKMGCGNSPKIHHSL